MAVDGQRELFGTDGIRGVPGEYPLDRETVYKLARALGQALASSSSSSALKVVLGEDTRESSAWISSLLAGGLQSEGIEVLDAGVITTPGVAFLSRHHRFAAGVMVSASHNPYQDNGIKVLSNSGMKIPESTELEIERLLRINQVAGGQIREAPLKPIPELLEDYLGFLEGLAHPSLRTSRTRLVADCAHGACFRVLPELARRLAIDTRILNAAPDGRNINLHSGSLHPEMMAQETKSSGADLGVAFDGDGDRALFATREGRIADGDHVLFAAVPFFEARGLLKGGAVVGTLMTNLGLELALARQGIGLKRTAVGDRYVLEEMLRSGINLGGEPSGHIIFSDLSLAGDGLITLIQILRLMAETGESLEELVRGLKPFPQVIRNVRVRDKPPLDEIPEVALAVAACRTEFGERGRVVVRYSGTEKLARVMVEADEAEAVERHAQKIADAIADVLGSA